MLVGYSRTQKGYRCFSPDLGQYLDFANVSFVEDRSFFVEYESSLYLYESDDLFLNLTIIDSAPPTHLDTGFQFFKQTYPCHPK